MHLTAEGAAFYSKCIDIMARIDEAKAALTQSPQLSGTLFIEVPIAFGQMVLAPALTEFAANNPELRLVVGFTNEIGRLLNRGVDVAIRMDEVDDGDLVARWLCEAKHVLCASPDFLRLQGLPSHPKQIDPLQCFGYTPNFWSDPRPWNFNLNGEVHKIEPKSNLTFNSNAALMDHAVKDGGFIYVLEIFARRQLQSGELIPVLPDWTTASQTFYAVYPKTRHLSPKLDRFLRFLHSVFDVKPSKESVVIPPLTSRR